MRRWHVVAAHIRFLYAYCVLIIINSIERKTNFRTDHSDTKRHVCFYSHSICFAFELWICHILITEDKLIGPIDKLRCVTKAIPNSRWLNCLMRLKYNTERQWNDSNDHFIHFFIIIFRNFINSLSALCMVFFEPGSDSFGLVFCLHLKILAFLSEIREYQILFRTILNFSVQNFPII